MNDVVIPFITARSYNCGTRSLYNYKRHKKNFSRSTRINPRHSGTLSTTKPTWTSLDLNPDLHGEMTCRFIDSLPAGRSWDRFPVKAWLSVLSRPPPKTNTVSCTMGTGPFPRVKQRKGDANQPPLIVLGFDWVGAVPLPPLCDCIGMSWGDLYLTSKLRSNRTTLSAMERPKSVFLNTVQLHLYGLIGTASHQNIPKIRIIGFFFDN